MNLNVFRAVYDLDDNEWWRLGSGDHQVLFDQACERIDELEAQITALVIERDSWHNAYQVTAEEGAEIISELKREVRYGQAVVA